MNVKKNLVFQAIKWELLNSNDKYYTYILCYGIKEDRKTILLIIKQFPYSVYAEVPEDKRENIAKILNSKYNNKTYYCKGLEKNKLTEPFEKDKKNLSFISLGFKNKDSVRNLTYANNRKIKIGKEDIDLNIHESRLDERIKLFSLKKLKPLGWIHVSEYYDIKESEKISYCDLEYKCSWTNISNHNYDKVIIPKILFFDIECYSSRHKEKSNSMPQCDIPKDKIIQISFVIKDDEKIDKYLLVLEEENKVCKNIKGTNIIRSKNEAELLLSFRNLFNKTLPQLAVGYNTFRFDWKYMVKRAEYLDCMTLFLNIGFLKNEKSIKSGTDWTSSAFGKNSLLWVDIHGTENLDLLIPITRNEKLVNYKLNTVSKSILGEEKKDLVGKKLFIAYDKGKLRKIGKYCIQDSLLPLKLLEKRKIFYDIVEMANTTQIPLIFALTRGQGVKFLSLLYSLCIENELILDFRKSDRNIRYTGANVLEPFTGASKHVFVLDFASLYPSIIIYKNICFTTYVTNKNIPDEKCNIIEWKDEYKDKTVKNRYRFIKQEHKKGLLPILLTNILNERSKVKGLLKVEKDSVLKVILDKRQLNLKLVANSIYGALTNKDGDIIFVEGGSCVTAVGRQMIEFVANYIRENYDISVLYGDSVTPDTPMLCKYKGKITYYTIDKIPIKNNWFKVGEKEIAEPDGGIEVWSDKGFTSIKYIIRHYTNKNIKRVLTNTGVIDVTEDHSLLTMDEKKISPKDLHIGDNLLHKDLPYFDFYDKTLNDIIKSTSKFQHNIGKDISMYTKDKLYTSYLFLSLRLLGCNSIIDLEKDNYKITPCSGLPEHSYKIKDIIDLGKSKDYVYDLETENHHFAAGIGNLVVHNTDSVFLKFNDESIPLENRFLTIKSISAKITSMFPKPVNLEFEKYMSKFVLIKKKKYAGIIVKDDGSTEILKKGIHSVRRENCQHIRNLIDRILEIYFNDKDSKNDKKTKEDIYETILSSILDLFRLKVNINDLIITKTLNKEEYKQKAVHSELAKKGKERGMDIRTGDKIEYLFIKINKNTKLQYERAEFPEYFKSHKYLKLDYLYYLEKQYVKPLDQLIKIIYDDTIMTKIYSYHKSYNNVKEEIKSLFKPKIIFK